MKTNTIRKNKGSKGKFWQELTIGVALVLIFWLLYLFIVQLSPEWLKNWLPSGLFEGGRFNLGAFGDYFGALNALFAGWAFAGLIVTIRQQADELYSTQCEMIKQTRQFRRDDIYRRLEIIKSLKSEIRIENHCGLAPEPFGDKRGNPKRGYEVYVLAWFAKDIERALLKNPDPLTIAELELKKECLHTCQIWIGPWLKSISCLLEDIFHDYGNDPEEVQRLFKMVIATLDIASQQLICQYEGLFVSPAVMPALEKAGLLVTDRPDKVSLLRKQNIHKLFLEIVTKNISVEAALMKWTTENAEKLQSVQ
ncbi:MAG: hypothetical protein IKW48_04950 [Akkermansia sp.]|nr:hypothetical protein [Akkermansia sp.]